MIEHLAISERLNESGYSTIVDERRLIRPPAFDVAIERIVASIEQSAGEPSIERRPRSHRAPCPIFYPNEPLRPLRPRNSRDRSASGYRRRHRYLSWRPLRVTGWRFFSFRDRSAMEPIPAGGFTASRSVTVYAVAGHRRRDYVTNGHPQECRKPTHHGLTRRCRSQTCVTASNPPKMIDTSWRGDTIRRGELKDIEGGESWLKVCH